MRDHFSQSTSGLMAEGVSLTAIAQAVGTPTYVYSQTAIEEAYRSLADVLSPMGVDVYYAIKANSSQAILSIFNALGAGVDIVSEGELRAALQAGIPANKIVFAGVGKTAREIAFALDKNIRQFNVESLPELQNINKVAAEKGMIAPVVLRINPDVDAQTHEKISTGQASSKFGIDLGTLHHIAEHLDHFESVDIRGLSMHIGSQIVSAEPFRQACQVMADYVQDLTARGMTLTHIDLGGGMGVVYKDEQPLSIADFAQVVKDIIVPLGLSVMVEPGHYFVANAGVLLSEVVYVKRSSVRSFVILDAAMNDLIRPSLYSAYHKIEPVAPVAADATIEPYDIVGPVCESGDTFAKGRELPPVKAGDLMVFRSAGAYAVVMASTYNTRLLPAEVLVKGDQFSVIRERQTYEDLFANDLVPDWL